MRLNDLLSILLLAKGGISCKSSDISLGLKLGTMGPHVSLLPCSCCPFRRYLAFTESAQMLPFYSDMLRRHFPFLHVCKYPK